jgi:hypothetical protein
VRGIGALHHAEAVLLVDHDQAQVRQGEPFGQQGVGADGDADLAHSQQTSQRAPLRRRGAAGEQGHTQVDRLRQAPQGRVVLLGQDLGRREHRRQPSGGVGRDGGQQRQHRLAGPDVSDQQAVHGMRPAQIELDLRPRRLLVGGELEGETPERALDPRVVDGEGLGAALRLALAAQGEAGLQQEQLLGDQAHVVGGPPVAQLIGIEVHAGPVDLP